MKRIATAITTVAVVIALATPASATPTSPSPSSSPTPTSTATPTSDLAANTGVPDYDIDPLLLDQLRAKLAHAKTAAAALERKIAAQRDVLARLVTQAETAHADAARAQQAAVLAHQQFAHMVQAIYMNGDNMVPPAITVLVSPGTSGVQDALDSMQMAQYALHAQQEQVSAAATSSARSARAARTAADAATTAQAQVTAMQTQAAAARKRVTNDEAAITARIEQVRKDLAAKRAAGAATANEAHTNWTAYTATLAAAHLTAPAAATLRNPAHLPPGLRPITDASGHPQAGIAKARYHHRDILVLPRETIAAIDFAFGQLGKPYIWAATGPNGFDCSGLMLAAYRTGGITGLPRISWDQYGWTTRIAAGQEMPGDLVFFAGSDGTMTRPGHVALVIDPASHLMIQAPETGDVVKVSRYDTWGGLVGFGRVTTAG